MGRNHKLTHVAGWVTLNLRSAGVSNLYQKLSLNRCWISGESTAAALVHSRSENNAGKLPRVQTQREQRGGNPPKHKPQTWKLLKRLHKPKHSFSRLFIQGKLSLSFKDNRTSIKINCKLDNFFPPSFIKQAPKHLQNSIEVVVFKYFELLFVGFFCIILQLRSLNHRFTDQNLTEVGAVGRQHKKDN